MDWLKLRHVKYYYWNNPIKLLSRCRNGMSNSQLGQDIYIIMSLRINLSNTSYSLWKNHLYICVFFYCSSYSKEVPYTFFIYSSTTTMQLTKKHYILHAKDFGMIYEMTWNIRLAISQVCSFFCTCL